MSAEIDLRPDEAWKKYIACCVNDAKWLENSKSISESIKLSRRELLGLVLYSYYLREDGSARICWNSSDQEPNDGHLVLSDNT